MVASFLRRRTRDISISYGIGVSRSPSWLRADHYLVPLASGSFSSHASCILHGLLFSQWTLYFAFQTW